VKVFRTKNDNSVYINLISIFCIFVTFIGLAFVILIMELNFYNKLKVGINNTFSTGTIISYYTNKIRNFNGGNIEVIKNKNQDILVLEDEESNLKTYIYVKDKAIYEHVTNISDKFDDSKGQKVFDVNKVSLEKDNKIIKMTIKTYEDDVINSYVNINKSDKK